MTLKHTLAALIMATPILTGAGVAQAGETLNALRTVACPAQTKPSTDTTKCTINGRRSRPANESPTNVRNESLFDKWRIERGVFSAIEMNGVMERN